MTPERYRQVGELYHAALELDADARGLFLERSCGADAELRREVESLIASHERASGFMGEPAFAIAAELLATDQSGALIGRQIARYRVMLLLGAGGMGRVYLGEDTALGRRVALKLLPEYFTHDKNQVQRFHQEARAASALNHPNILTVYEVGQVEGHEFIATEYVEGETLRDRLSHGPLGVCETLEIATQIADALGAAHAAGIVHRDIKPENIMLREDGYVKVLDFGLAKLTENISERFFDSEAKTKPVVRTNPGVVMGTAGYMSPEQARGLEVDARTDVWALGVLIYEMVSGSRPFEEPTHGDTIVAILQREAVPLSRYVSEVPTELERITAKALTKDVETRYQTVKEMGVDLKQLRRRLEIDAEIGSSSTTSRGAASNGSDGGRGKVAETSLQKPGQVNAAKFAHETSSVEYLVSEIKEHKGAVLLITLLLVVSLGGVTYGLYKVLNHAKPLAPFQTTKVTRLTSTGKVKDAAISPDGKYLVYMEEDAKGQSLWVKQVATGSSVQITPPAEVGYWGLTFSNDSNYVYFVRNEKNNRVYMLHQIPTLGGASKKLIEDIDSAVAFSPDGQQLAFVRSYKNKRESALVITNADGTGERTLATRKSPDSFLIDDTMRLSWSPDGNLIACPVQSLDGNGLYYGVAAVRVGDGSQMPLTSHRWGWISQVAWLASGKGLVMLAADKTPGRFSMQLWHLNYPGGEARRITNDLNGYRALSLTSDSRSFITVQTNRVSNLWVAQTAAPNRIRQITSGTIDGFYGLAWTPDGKILYRSNAGGKPDIWLMDVDGRSQRQLTHDGDNSQPSVSPGGSYIVFTSTLAGRANVWRMDMDGGNPRQLTDGKINRNPHLSPDGRWIVYQSIDAGVSSISKVSIEGGPSTVVSDTRANFPVVSPDGKQIACFYWDDQAVPSHGVMIFPFEGGQPTKRFNIPSSANGFALGWSADGRALLYIDNRLTNIWSQPVDGSEPVQLTDLQGDQVFNFDYSADGKWLALARGRVTDDVVLISDLK